MLAVRGAIQVERNDAEAIRASTRRLLGALLRRNRLSRDQIVSAFFTVTPDLDADFPAAGARDLGWDRVPMLGAREMDVPGAPPRILRVMLHVRDGGPLEPVYLGAARALRPDLPQGAESGTDAGSEGRDAPAGRAAAGAPRRGGDELDDSRMLIVGLGLIGTSIGLALREAVRLSFRAGVDPDPERRVEAVERGAVRTAAAEPGRLLQEADVVVLALPAHGIGPWIRRWGGALRSGALVLDTASTKRGPVSALRSLPDGVQGVGGHPLAGSERSGFGAARPDLFRDAPWALVRTGRSGACGERLAEALVVATGARPVWMEAAAHDRAVARTSHLPYLLSVALARQATVAGDAARIAGPGLRGMTRLARGPATLMAGILFDNRDHLRREAAAFADRWAGWLRALDEAGSAADLERALAAPVSRRGRSCR